MKKTAILGFGALALMSLSACAFDDDDDEDVVRTTTTETTVSTVPTTGVTTQTQTVQPVVY
jgi:ABC-type phosphate/phosphonate transport system substrate-binding protein